MHALTKGNTNIPFIDIVAGVSENAWFWIGNEWMTSFFIGFILGVVCLIGDATGSFFKRRKGLVREGKETSRAPFLDTLPFAIALFVFGGLFMGNAIIKWENVDLVYSPHGVPRVILAGFLLLLSTPFLHRAFNMFGYRMYAYLQQVQMYLRMGTQNLLTLTVLVSLTTKKWTTSR